MCVCVCVRKTIVTYTYYFLFEHNPTHKNYFLRCLGFMMKLSYINTVLKWCQQQRLIDYGQLKDRINYIPLHVHLIKKKITRLSNNKWATNVNKLQQRGRQLGVWYYRLASSDPYSIISPALIIKPLHIVTSEPNAPFILAARVQVCVCACSVSGFQHRQQAIVIFLAGFT